MMGKSCLEIHCQLLLEEVKALTELLENPEYGFFTWALSVNRQIDRIALFKTIRIEKP